MKVLHLNSYYIDNQLYSQFYQTLAGEIEQEVFIPIKFDREPVNVVDLDKTRLTFVKIIKPIHKFNYFIKIKRITRSIISKINLKAIDFVHAHNLYTDGAVAYHLKNSLGIKYIVAIRETDIGLQYKKMLHRRSFIHKVLNDAERIVFISASYRDKLFEMLPQGVAAEISNKVYIIPNGINDIWLMNSIKPASESLGRSVKILFVGQIRKRKNILILIEALEKLNNDLDSNFSLTVIGPEYRREPEYFSTFIKKTESLGWVNYLGEVTSEEELMQEYRKCHIFAMPSKSELFGLVYIEALSQGKPVLYSKGEGIENYLREYNVGVSVDPDNSGDIADGILTIVRNYKEYTDFDAAIKPFNWNRIARLYKTFYYGNE